MKVCPMCGTFQEKAGAKVCEWCNYEQKPLDAISEQEFDELMAAYEYERTEDGIRIKAVKSIRLRGTLSIPHFVTEIAAHAFACCKFITRIFLPQGLRSIGEGAFADCEDLFDVFIPESVCHIGKGAFSDCHGLGVICAAAAAQPKGWDSEWLADCSASVEWASAEED